MEIATLSHVSKKIEKTQHPFMDNYNFVRNEKIINDNIHGRLPLPAVCVEIIDTPPFQRLRHLKQLGLCHFVYPTASHSRFEHSIGVMHLAGKLLRSLLERQPVLRNRVSKIDILCVQVAALCHDIGHGPFSHVFDVYFLDRIIAKRQSSKDCWTHEKNGCKILREMVDTKLISLEKYGINHIEDLQFIEECIMGLDQSETSRRDSENAWERERFLYFIVNNTESGLDVDKLDYYKRDCRGAGLHENDSFPELIDTGEVRICSDGCGRITYPQKYYNSVLNAFRLRFQLHQKIYQNHIVIGLDYMLVDALYAAHTFLRFVGSENRLVTLKECLDDPSAYRHLNDSIWLMIQNSTDPNLKKAQNILRRIETRDIYKCVGSVPISNEIQRRFLNAKKSKGAKGFAKEEREVILKEILAESTVPRGQAILVVCDIHYGKQELNPVDSVFFYNKNSKVATKVDSSKLYNHLLPIQFIDRHIRLYVKELKYVEKASNCFSRWYDNLAS